MTKTTIAIVLLLAAIGCKTVTTTSGEKVSLFKGTIVYDVAVEQTVDTAYQKNKKAFYGDEMYLTVFRNGNIQRKYNGTSTHGYDLHYIDIEKNTVLQKYNHSDSLYAHKASTQNVIKINNLRSNNEKTEVLGRELTQVAIGAESIDVKDKSRKYLTLKYWYADDVKIDKTKYTEVNDDLWNYFLNKSNGSIYLKYEIDYFTYKVTYTAKSIQPNKFVKTKEKRSEEAPVVEY